MIRSATPADAFAIASIYNHYVRETTVTFEECPVSVDEMATRIAEVTTALPWLVLEVDKVILGYAYGSKWKTRSAYRFAAEISIYLAIGQHRCGFGSQLLQALLDELRERSMHLAIGGAALPNDASTRLMEKFGFTKVGHLREVGYKFDRWIDVGYWQLSLQR